MKNAKLLFCSLFLSLLCFEALLRVLNISYPAYVRPDAVTAFSYRPKLKGLHAGEGGKVPIEFNSEGFNDEEWQPERKPNTFRIAIIGDSMVQALDVPREANFSSIIERKLSSACHVFQGRQIEILNFGAGGHGTAQEFLTLKHRVMAYKPELVILGFFGGNDIRNNHRGLQQEALYPYFVEKNGQLVLDDSFKGSGEYLRRQRSLWTFLQSVADHVRILQVVNESRKKWKDLRAVMRDKHSTTAVTREFGLDYSVFSQPTTAEWKEAWSVTEKLIVEIRNEVHQYGSRFLLLGIGTGSQTNPSAEARKKVMLAAGIDDLFYVERRLDGLAKREGIAYLPLVYPMAENALRTGTYFYGGKVLGLGVGHLNESGHSFVSQLTIDKICSMYSDHQIAQRNGG